MLLLQMHPLLFGRPASPSGTTAHHSGSALLSSPGVHYAPLRTNEAVHGLAHELIAQHATESQAARGWNMDARGGGVLRCRRLDGLGVNN